MSQEQSVTYAIVFKGQVIDGFQIISVKDRLAKMLKADAKKISTLFSGKVIVIKRTTNKQEAIKYGSALRKVGADVQIKVVRNEAVTAKPEHHSNTRKKTDIAAIENTAPASRQTQTINVSEPDSANHSSDLVSAQAATNRSIVTLSISARAPDFTLAENKGDLFEPAAEETPIVVNVDNIDLADNDGSPMTQPEVKPRLDLDLSAISVAENDGSPIVEPMKMAEKIEAPDFDLDAPGAVLGTIQEHVTHMAPDVSNISLAFAGSNLLSPDEIDEGPAPVVPDVSNIKLVANKASFDAG